VPDAGAQTSNVTNDGKQVNTNKADVPIAQQECSSNPMSMLSGEEISPLTDFELGGLMPLVWRRLYRSGK